MNLFLLGFLHYLEEVEYFGKRVLPLVRELEAQQEGAQEEATQAPSRERARRRGPARFRRPPGPEHVSA